MTLPILGAAMTLEELEIHRHWLLEKQRDLELQSFVDAEVLGGDWKPLVERTKTLLDGHTGRVGIHGPFWGFTIASKDPGVRAVVAERMRQALDVSAAIGATHMVVHSPYTTWNYNNLDNNPGARESIIEYTQKTMGDAVKRAEDIGLTMVMENIEDIDPEIRNVLVDSFASPAVAVSIDTGHAHYAHGSTGGPPVDYYVHAAGNRLQHVHLQDADGYADRHWSLGEGTIRWHSVFAALAKLTSNPRLIIEIKDKSKIPASAAYLESLGLAQ
ncbi:sugar phosphate isomerase/epimerase family protein [Rhizobium sp. L80/93]|uniref:Sugar phosphate isomerase/epimerase n=1 Tax=Rhizobium tumorigenes TaxID=2041385 RepID=A0AAF1K3P9_9HYPH|nr:MULTISPECIES: sugar phosphate isomerase/epimerase family protein [Rhizobium]MBO9135470.1 sugar phosphate isomerase/epimerase [Rhizobium sp. B209b/85]MBO9170326.1 sugar phosphate isomerase/epimerase [Rhizobium sp. L245/93]MBO9186283.1 sugar phosphate isomerase/epimerase [Rhizobium sp. E27B/91]QXZ96364.1 sugar phosphate isomerase/epimerase [Rhizobium sp. B230/85]QYA01879.1 sugar phosphate isomerase/epimerase [Rhizobium sp. B21/90]